VAIFVFNQSVKIDSLIKYSSLSESSNLILTTQFLFKNEREKLEHTEGISSTILRDRLNNGEMAL